MNWTKNIIGENSTLDIEPLWSSISSRYGRCLKIIAQCGDEPHCATACDEEECDCNYCACDDYSG